MTVRIGMVGPGGMGRAHIQRLRSQVPGCELVAVSDVDPDNLARVAADPGTTNHPCSAHLIADPGVDAVIVCSRGPAHAADVIAAVERGKPVLCEKPLAPTAEECVAIMRAEREAGRRLVTGGFMRRFDASYRQLKHLLDSGDLGEALIVHGRHRNPTVVPYYTRDMAITDTAIHDIDIARYLLGKRSSMRAWTDRGRPGTRRSR